MGLLLKVRQSKSEYILHWVRSEAKSSHQYQKCVKSFTPEKEIGVSSLANLIFVAVDLDILQLLFYK